MNNVNQDKVITFVTNNPKSTPEAIAEGTGIFKLNVFKLLKTLVESDTLKVVEVENKKVYFISPTNASGKVVKQTKASGAVDEIKVQKPEGSRSTDKYSFNGQSYGVGRLALAIVKKYVQDNPRVSIVKIKEVFKENEIQPRYKILTEIPKARKIATETGRERHYLKDTEVVSINGKKYAITNQWSKDNIKPLIAIAKSLRYTIR